eukprot:TRINITY_DN11763_c0_g3_i1.p1 TRINITY_DN11763_c0_g3~~TRINITY_DN11763_c0_g3_i1.p1  ORF type:complete len:153 (+),score=19.63 TRINITY_DN11763_c0_g3_i1:210-668(+)
MIEMASASDTSGDASYAELLASQENWFAVEPRKDCPHLSHVAPVLDFELSTPCAECGNEGENWVCLTCSRIGCSRYVNQHMLEHCTSASHPLAFSFSDFSFWCFACNDYVTSPLFKPILRAANTMKFGSQDEAQSSAGSAIAAADMDTPSLD